MNPESTFGWGSRLMKHITTLDLPFPTLLGAKIIKKLRIYGCFLLINPKGENQSQELAGMIF